MSMDFSRRFTDALNASAKELSDLLEQAAVELNKVAELSLKGAVYINTVTTLLDDEEPKHRA